jgi:serine/threonine-protein kinase
MSLDPRNGQWPWEYAVTLAILRRYPAALVAYDRALTLLPVSSGAVAEKIWILAVTGNPAEARRTLARITQRNDSLGTLLLVRFRLAMLERQPGAALAVFEGAAEKIGQVYAHGTVPSGLLKGDALAARGQRDAAHAAFENARSTLEAALVHQPADPNIWSLLGMADAGLGQWNDAIAAGRKATELLPVSKDAFYGPLYLVRLAKIYAQAGQADAAAKLLDRLLAMPAGEYVSVPLLKLDPTWDPIRNDPRFQALLKKYAGDDAVNATARDKAVASG